MGKVLGDTIQVVEDKYVMTLAYNKMADRASSPIMQANKTYTILVQSDKSMGQTQWELWAYTESGQLKIQSFGTTDMSVQQSVSYTPSADIYALGSKYSSGVQETTAMMTYIIPYGTYTHSLVGDLSDVIGFGDVIVLNRSGVPKPWDYRQMRPIMEQGKKYLVSFKASSSYTPASFELWGADYEKTYASRLCLKKVQNEDLSVEHSFEITASQDFYTLYRGSGSSESTDVTFTYKVVEHKESARLKEIEEDIAELQDDVVGAGMNEFDGYYRIGSVVNDTCNLITRPIGLIVMGQSNADGRIPNADFPATATIDTTDDLTLYKQLEHCLFMQGDKEQSYGESNKNFASRNNSGNWAFDDIVYNAVNQALGGNTDFYVLKQTRGATGIRFSGGSFNANVNEFVKNGYTNSQLFHFKLLIERAMSLNPNINFKAVLWHQGEAEYQVTEEGVYYRCLCQVIYWLRGKVGNPKLPFIFGTVPTDSEQYSAVVKADMERVAQDINDCYLVDLGAAGDMIDAYHFGPSTAERLAREMYKIMRQNYMLTPMITPVS